MEGGHGEMKRWKADPTRWKDKMEGGRRCSGDSGSGSK